MYKTSESDWKLFKQLLPIWRERYFNKLLEEYNKILSKNALSSEKFWELSNKMNKDKTIILRKVTKDEMLIYFLDLLKYSVIKESDLEGFFELFKANVKGWRQHLLIVDP